MAFTTKAEVCRILGVTECNFKSKHATFKGLIDKLTAKLAGWKQRALLAAGRTVLIKLIAQTLPTFIMQTLSLPKGR